jgi:hypothetical protein
MSGKFRMHVASSRFRAFHRLGPFALVARGVHRLQQKSRTSWHRDLRREQLVWH